MDQPIIIPSDIPDEYFKDVRFRLLNRERLDAYFETVGITKLMSSYRMDFANGKMILAVITTVNTTEFYAKLFGGMIPSWILLLYANPEEDDGLEFD